MRAQRLTKSVALASFGSFVSNIAGRFFRQLLTAGPDFVRFLPDRPDANPQSPIYCYGRNTKETRQKQPGDHSEKNKAMRTKRRDRLSPVPLSCSGAKSGTRTHDLFVTNEMLYRLSYFGNVRILAELRVQIWEKFPEFPAKTFIFFRRATYEVHTSLIISHINNSMQAMIDDPEKQRPKRRQPFLGSERTSPAMPYEKNSPYKGCPSKPSRPRTAFAATRREGSATARARRS